MAPASHRAHIPGRPSREEFLAVFEEFLLSPRTSRSISGATI
jgi:hypothetical protein